MVGRRHIEELAEQLPPEWRAGFVHFCETGEADKRLVEFLEQDKVARAVVEVVFNETADALQGLAQALRAIGSKNADKDLSIVLIDKAIIDKLRDGGTVTLGTKKEDAAKTVLHVIPEAVLQEWRTKTGASMTDIFNDMGALYKRALKAREENMQIAVVDNGKLGNG